MWSSPTITDGASMRAALPVSPGEMLEEVLLEPLGLAK